MCAKRGFRSACVFAVWSKYSLDAFWIAKDAEFIHADNDDWFDCADAQADLSPRRAYVFHVAVRIRKYYIRKINAITALHQSLVMTRIFDWCCNEFALRANNEKDKVKVRGTSQTAAFPRHQKEEKTDKTKQAQIKQTYEKH